MKPPYQGWVGHCRFSEEAFSSSRQAWTVSPGFAAYHVSSIYCRIYGAKQLRRLLSTRLPAATYGAVAVVGLTFEQHAACLRIHLQCLVDVLNWSIFEL